MLTLETGPIFQPKGKSDLCDGRLVARRFEVRLSDEALAALGFELARAYMPPHRYTADSDAAVAHLLPTEDHIRKGDFGEFLTHLLYTQIFDHEIPFSRLWSKPAPNSTQQGADSVSVIAKPGESPRPFTVETKVRTGATGSGNLLIKIRNSMEILEDPSYLIAAWSSGLDKLEAHPAARRAYAYAIAHHLALLDGTPLEELPPYERHVVIITDGIDIQRKTIESYWDDPPVKALSIVKIVDLPTVINHAYAEAGSYTAGKLLGTTSGKTVDIGEDPEPFTKSGLVTPIDPADLASWRATTNTEPHPVVEAALWYLANYDGIARARALTAINHIDAATAVLAKLLIGNDKEAKQAASAQSLSVSHLLEVVSDVLAYPASIHEDKKRIVQARDEVIQLYDDSVHRMAIWMTAEAICYRLDRLPQRFLTISGIKGNHICQVGNKLYESGKHALWPSQVSTIKAGLLSSPPRSFVMKLPTSGGKTDLIALAAANVLDYTPNSRVVILAPTRALVNQLREDLHSLLFDGGVQVLALHGELELSDELPTNFGDLVTIMTPERFDLDWRRSTTITEIESISDRISAVIVDEAHFLSDDQRGARLELALSRVLRLGVPIILASSQLSDLPALAGWINGTSSETNWQPAHHIRQVYYRDQLIINNNPNPSMCGYLIDETNAVDKRLTILPRLNNLVDPTLATRFVRDQGAALATQFSQDGLVVLFTATKRYISGLADDLYRRVKDDPPPNSDVLSELANLLPRTANSERELLRVGIGIHHRDVSLHKRQIVERAARQNDLRYLICTSTLLEGVDYPIRTVLMVYTQYGPERLNISDLRNLEGRAGRGGKYTSGRVVVFAKDRVKAKSMLRLFRSELPPTASRLVLVFEDLRRRADKAELGPLEPFLLAAITEAAITDGELRISLEKILGRSLYFAGLSDIQKASLLNAVEIHANRVKSRFTSPWLIVAYRTGLPLTTCALIRKGLENTDLSMLLELSGEASFDSANSYVDRVIRTLLADVIVEVPELHWPDIEKSFVG